MRMRGYMFLLWIEERTSSGMRYGLVTLDVQMRDGNSDDGPRVSASR